MEKINQEYILQFIKRHNLITPRSSVALGLSGGPDSVFLLYILVELQKTGLIKNLIAAHLDHQWRANSASDVVFCEQLANQFNIPFISAKLAEFSPKKTSGSKEDMGRQARRAFLTKVAKDHNANTIAIAHHQDDQQETFFLRLIRGASLAGLTGMKPKHGMFIRPLLEVSKTEILKYLDSNNIPYLTDPSNASHEYLRNRIRLNVIPALRSCDDRFDASFMRTLKSLQETEDFLDILTMTTFESLATHRDESFYLDIKQLLAQHPAMVYRLLVHWFCREGIQFPVSQGFFNEIIKFLSQPGGSTHQTHESWSLVKQKGQTLIVRKNNENKKNSLCPNTTS